jgi:hypothetical protein
MYDLIIFPTIWLEGVILGVKTKPKTAPDENIEETNMLTEDTIDHFDETIEIREPQE